MAKIGVIESDYKIVKQIKEALERMSSPPEFISFVNVEDALIKINAEKFDMLLVAATAIGKSNPIDWLKDMREVKISHPENKNMHFLLMEFDTPIDNIKRLLRSGWSDFIVKPVDNPLLVQKIELHFSSSGAVEKQVYSLQVSQPVGIAIEALFEEISEFGGTIRTTRRLTKGELISLYSAIFSEKGEKGEVLGKIYKENEHPNIKGEYQAKVEFIGVHTLILKLIRSWLRKEYVNKKQNG